MQGNSELTAFLIKNKVNLEVKNKDGHTALSLAIIQGDTKLVKRLIREGADLNVKDNDGECLLHLARNMFSKSFEDSEHIQRDFLNIVLKLIKSGADLEVEDVVYSYPLLLWLVNWDLDHSHIDLIIRVTAKGANVNAVNYLNETALHLIAKKMDFEHEDKLKTVKLSIEHGADLQAREIGGRTPFDVATLQLKNFIGRDLLLLEFIPRH